jgi:hypothetical protein
MAAVRYFEVICDKTDGLCTSFSLKCNNDDYDDDNKHPQHIKCQSVRFDPINIYEQAQQAKPLAKKHFYHHIICLYYLHSSNNTRSAGIYTYMPICFSDPKPVNTAEYETCQ